MTNFDPGFLVLAAGRSRRFGGNKLAAKLGSGETVLATTLKNLLQVSSRVAVVFSCDGLFVRDTTCSLGAIPIAMPGISAGLSDSIAFGVQSTHEWQGWVICLADMPFVSESVYSAVLQEAETSTLVRPVYKGKHGHPVFFARQFMPQLSALSGDTGARKLLRQHAEELTTVAVQDPGVLRDIDRVQDLEPL